MTGSTTPPGEGLLEVGRIVRPHGLRGEVTVDFVSDRPERREPGAVLHADSGVLTVAECRPHQARWLVRFEGCTTREDADVLRGAVLRAAPLENEGTLFVHELVGCRVVDSHGVDRGRVAAVEANPAHDLLVLDDGTLVPSAFVRGAPSEGVVRVEAPDGLFDL